MTSADLLRNVEQLVFWLRQSLQQKRELWPAGHIRMPTRIGIINKYINNVYKNYSPAVYHKSVYLSRTARWRGQTPSSHYLMYHLNTHTGTQNCNYHVQ